MSVLLRFIVVGFLLGLCSCSGGGSGASGTGSHDPIITLNGNAIVTVNVGSSYVDDGATAQDDEDGDLTSAILTTSTVDTATAGSYSVTYEVSDSDGHTVSAVRTIFVLASSVDAYAVDWLDQFSLPAQDADGWSLLTPSVDSRIIYVSSSEGDDANAVIYAPDDAVIGADVFHPEGRVMAYSSIAAAVAQMREGYPDYVLLKRGDSWSLDTDISLVRKGRSARERQVLGAYGDLSSPRPLVLNAGLVMNKSGYIAVVGLHLCDDERNPGSSQFVGFDHVSNSSGIGATVYSNVGGILIEDCWFEWFGGNAIQSWAFDDKGNMLDIPDIIVRRNIFNNNYSTSSHSQGLYSNLISILVEENIFDHNGWYKQGQSNAQAQGMATMFNHNTYFSGTRNTIMRNNIFLRSSSIQNKFTSNTSDGINKIAAQNILVENNFYAEGEIGISLGGNSDQNNGPRWDNIVVVNNVMTAIGRSFPTNRTLGWGIDVNDWRTGLVSGNLLTSWGEAGVYTNTYGFNVVGHTTDTLFSDNIAYNIVSEGSLMSFSDGDVNGAMDRITLRNNEIAALTNTRGRLVSYSMIPQTQDFGDNYYYFAKSDDQWFDISGARTDFAEFADVSEDTTSVLELRHYVDPDRSIGTFLNDMGYSSEIPVAADEIPDLLAVLKQQRKGHWDKALTAQSLNDYFREGFCIAGNSDCR